MPKQFLYFLTNAQGQSFRVDENNIVVTSTLPVPQKNAPDGWQDKMVQFGRSAKYFGLFRSFTIPLRFVKAGAKIIRQVQYGSGFEGICYLIILKLNYQTMKHESWYKGEIDLSKARDRRDYFEVNVLEGGTRKLLSANEGKTYEFPLDVNAEVLELDGILLKNGISYIIQPGPALAFGNTLLGCIFISSEGVYRDILFNSPSSFTRGTLSEAPENTDYLIRNDGPAYTFNLRAKYDVTAAFNTSQSVGYRVSDGTTYTGSRTTIFSGTITANQPLHVEFDILVTLEKGQRLHIDTVGGGELPPNPFIYSEGGTLDIKFDYRMPATRHRAYTAVALGAKLGDKITEGTATLSAPGLAVTGAGTEADPYRSLLVISGDGIRRFENAVIKTTFNDFYKAMNVVKFVGLDIVNEQIEIHPRAKFYDDPVVYDYGEAKDCEVTLAEDIIYNQVKIGSPDQDYDDVNGRSEVNTIQEYGLPVTRIVTDCDLISPYRHDCYGIEYTRVNMEGKTTTDNSSDNDVFLIDAIGVRDETGLLVWRPYRKAYTEMTGIITDTIFNVELSPKRLLLLHYPELAPIFYKMVGKEVTFQKSEKNAELVTTYDDGSGPVTIAEKANIPATIDGALFLPYYFNIKTKTAANYLALHAAARAGNGQFTWLGKQWTGFLIDGGIKQAALEEQTIKLLAAPGNDLTKLIR
ncbi:hypothetical protein ACFOTA_06915 [Chitinophaga sp. GCM10012297]|uniref:Uncharacterized protein n=1 Tax=Chitinophaga chungangae TaxID=2821488 RepID=A0ABS3YBU6_9BACT|nr:hypothetical protein [Chitinophaga chungangae]MBO9151930.1 hypothetical protein [Chitinophaga chungangae]